MIHLIVFGLLTLLALGVGGQSRVPAKAKKCPSGVVVAKSQPCPKRP